MKQLLIVISLFWLSLTGYSQTLDQLTDTLIQFRTRAVEGQSDDEALFWNAKMERLLLRIFHFEDAFSYDFSKVPQMSILTSPDKYFRMFNWNLQMQDGKHLFYCNFLINPKKKTKKRVHILTHKDTIYLDPERESLKEDEWMGALYYEIIPKKQKKLTFYTLLGWMGTEGLTNTKVVETLAFQSRGVRFGVNSLRVDRRLKKRMLFDYNKNVKMTIRYEEEEDRILMDALSPEDPRFSEHAAFYSPSFKFHALVWDKDFWIFKRNVDALAPENKKLKERMKASKPKKK